MKTLFRMRWYIGLFLVILLVGLIGRFWWWIFPHFVPVGQFQNADSMNVEYGVMGAIFTFAAFAILVVSLQIQHWETLSQRKGEEQARITSDFFQMVQVWHGIIYNTRFLAPNEQAPAKEGRDAFAYMSKDLTRHSGLIMISGVCAQEVVEAIYQTWFVKGPIQQLAHYFRFLYHIVRFVDRSPLKFKERKALLKILRAQLSESELHLLFWNGISSYGKNFKPLIDKYDLLKNFSFSSNYGIKKKYIAYYPKTFARLQCINHLAVSELASA